MEVIDNILLYIQQHFDEDLSLNTLASQAHYSPYHFHRLFRQQVGEAPKQYLSRLRLEKAIKELVFYPDKAIYAIAIDCGFSSQSVFARAFKGKYLLTAEQYRTQALETIRQKTSDMQPDVQQYPVSVTRMERIQVATQLTLLQPEDDIINVFRKLQQWATARELLDAQPEYYGIFIDSPFATPLSKCRYLAGIRIRHAAEGRECSQLGGITVAQIPVQGSFDVLSDYALYVKKRWMNDNGYEIIPGIPGFERFAAIDFNKPYAQHYRTICIGIQPK